MKTIMYINIYYLILTRKISNQIILKKKYQKKKNIIIIKNITIIGIRGSMIIIILQNIIILEEIIIIIEITEIRAIQGKRIIARVKVINIIVNIVNINIGKINIVQIVEPKKINHHIHHLNLNLVNQIQNHLAHHIRINLPYYIPIQFMK